MDRSVTQDWVMDLPLMQQAVLLECLRGPDTITKYHPCKYLLRWYRRCIIITAFQCAVFDNPYEPTGGSFDGPSYDSNKVDYPKQWEPHMDALVSTYIGMVDEIPHHFHLHLMHGVEILGYKHPNTRIRAWWNGVYVRLVHDMHLWPETAEQLNQRLGDSRAGWMARGDEATMS